MTKVDIREAFDILVSKPRDEKVPGMQGDIVNEALLGGEEHCENTVLEIGVQITKV